MIMNTTVLQLFVFVYTCVYVHASRRNNCSPRRMVVRYPASKKIIDLDCPLWIVTSKSLLLILYDDDQVEEGGGKETDLKEPFY